MARTPVFNERRLVIGYIDDHGNGQQTALNKNAIVIGYYDSRNGNTLDKNRMVIGKGNQLMGLIKAGC